MILLLARNFKLKYIAVNLIEYLMELEKPKKFDSFLARLVMLFIILATIFTVYLTVKLVVTGFTFR
jgi:hypothetical protein